MNFSRQDYSEVITKHTSTAEIAQFMSRVYGWMMAGVLLTAFVAFQAASRPEVIQFIFSSQLNFWIIVLLQFAAVIYLSAAIQKMSAFTASVVYLAYSALTGLTFSVILLAYTQQSIASAFAVTAISFGGLSAWAYVTRRDLGPIGSFCIMGLFGVIGISLLSYFFPSMMGEMGQKVLSGLSIIVFAGLTAYDTQRIKSLAVMSTSGEALKKSAIYGALMLYLDFINLFISILRLFGSRK